MAKKVINKIKLQAPAGGATPQLGTVLGPAGINIQDFCSQFNERTKEQKGDILPVELTVYEDRTFDFIVKTPPAAFLIKKAAKIDKGSAKGRLDQVATISVAQLKEIAETKLPDLNAYDIEQAMKIIEGTAKNMGVAIEGKELATAEEIAEAKAHEEAMAKVAAEEEKEKEATESVEDVAEEAESAEEVAE